MGPIVIIGNGIAGITTARQVRKRSTAPIIVISSETEHFFSRTALMYIFMGHMKYEHTKPYEDWFWEKNKIQLIHDHVEQVNFKGKSLQLRSGKTVSYEKLVLATGSKPNKFGWPGQDLKGVQSLYSYQDLELLEENVSQGVRKAVIVGGGLIGIELAEMLHTRNIEVTFLVREDGFWRSVLPKENAELVNRHITEEHHLDMRYGCNLKEIVPDENGRVKSVIIEETGEEIPCELVGLTAGVSPNVDFLRNTELEIDKGILVNAYLETNIDFVYAVGDCVQFKNPAPGRRAIEPVWYTGRMMGECLGQTLSELRKAYKPGVWFNSAKFFDIEYQTYGTVNANPQEHEGVFHWEHKSGKKSLYIVYDKKSQQVIGVNAFGIRLRHHVMDYIIRNKHNIQYLIEHLRDVNFDPEFYKNHSKEIAKAYETQFQTKVRLKYKNWFRIMKATKESILQ